jgi:hypothetical protein
MILKIFSRKDWRKLSPFWLKTLPFVCEFKNYKNMDFHENRQYFEEIW